jgi:UDP-3-O-[3-hydroxymyristoyl] glucosamine N-acyltransferase
MKFKKPKTLGEIAAATSSRLSDTRFADVVVTGINTADGAEEGDLVWAESKEAVEGLAQSPARAAILPPKTQGVELPALLHPLPKLIFGMLLREFIPIGLGDPSTNEIDPTVVIDPRAIIGGGIKIGPRTQVMAGAVVGYGCQIGADCSIGYNAVLNWGTQLADRVIIHSCSVLGTDGFGYVQKPVDGDPTTWESLKVPHAGIVVVEEDVEIGANVCIDRGLLQPTVISRGTKIDNLVQIGHNCKIGPHNILVGQAGFSGSITTGKNVIAAGQAGIADHTIIGDRAVLMAGVKLAGTVPADSKLIGYPPLDRNVFFRWTTTLQDILWVPKILKAATSSATFEEFRQKLAEMKAPERWFRLMGG